MTTLHDALQVLNTTSFKEITPKQASDIGSFMERALAEIITREGEVTAREKEVATREANVTVREENVDARLNALTSLETVHQVLGASRRETIPTPSRGFFSVRRKAG